MFHVYVIRSETTGRLYVGHTSDLTQRVGQHNSGIMKSTKNRGPWNLIHHEHSPTKADAMWRGSLTPETPVRDAEGHEKPQG